MDGRIVALKPPTQATQDPATADRLCEATRENADASHRRRDNPGDQMHSKNFRPGILRLFPRLPILAFLKYPFSRFSRLSRRHQHNPKDNFERDIFIIIPHADGHEDKTKLAVAKFDTGSDHDFISERLVRDFEGVVWYDVHSQCSPILHSVQALDGRQIQILGEVALRWRGKDEEYRSKKIFFPSRYISSKFLIVSSEVPLDVVIGRPTYQEESLDEKNSRCWLGQGGRRPHHPEVAKDRDRQDARQRQVDSRAAEKVEQDAQESADDEEAEKKSKKKH